MDKIQRIKELVKTLNNASELYYNGKKSNLTDKQWDNYFDELKILEKEIGIIYSNSPTENVGYTVLDGLEKVAHDKKMDSLDKTKDIAELKKFLGDKTGVLAWKEDGLTIVLYYNNGKLIDAITRGNGDIGSRILHNAKVFKNIPQTISYKGKLVVRGEGLISKEDFEQINIRGEYANPRNLASGSIMQLDNKIAKQRHLQFKAFNIAECDKEFELYSDQLKWLKSIGFDIVEHLIVDKNNLEECIKVFSNSINKYKFATDGLVLSFNDIQYRDSLGSTGHHSLGWIAFKWQDTTEETILRNIEWTIGRTGVLTPTAIFDTVNLEGTDVSRASLHNVSILKGLELGIGDSITVYKANMIIPQLDDNLTRSNTYKIPKHCPVCNGEASVLKTDNAEFLMCDNPNCSAKLVQKIKHFVSRNAINIEGLSEKTIEKFIEKGFINDIVDIYKLDKYKKEIVSMSGFGLKSYNNLIKAIEKSKICKLPNLIFGLGVNLVGLETAKLLVKACNNDINNIFKADKLFLRQIDGIGEVVSREIYKYFGDEVNRKMINELIQYVEFEQEEKANASNSLEGKIFVVTGDVHIFKNRNELKTKIESCLGKVAGSVSSKTNFLINNDSLSGSSKNKKAKELGVKIITEEQFLDMIGE